MEKRPTLEILEKYPENLEMPARTRRLREQKWLLDFVISTAGLEWDLLRMGMATAPVGFEAMGDWSQVATKAKRFDEITPSFAEVAARRETRAREAEQRGDEITARESYLVASIYYGIAQWPIDDVSELNLELNAKKLECYSRYAARAHHKIERVENGPAYNSGVVTFPAVRTTALSNRDH
jgi:hypothetical protein